MNTDPKQVEEINKWLREKYGLFEANRPNWRVVFSDDQYEKRFGDYEDRTPEGFFIRRVQEVREVPKYKYIPSKYILERLLPVDSFNWGDLVEKTSYECIWTFRDKHGNALPPKISVCHYVIETVYANAAQKVGVKYQHPYHDPKTRKDVREAELKKVYDDLYGNESDVTDALAYKRAVVVPDMNQKTEQDKNGEQK